MENILRESSKNNNNLAQSAELDPGLRYTVTEGPPLMNRAGSIGTNF
jgi:hypothetical protein